MEKELPLGSIINVIKIAQDLVVLRHKQTRFNFNTLPKFNNLSR